MYTTDPNDLRLDRGISKDKTKQNEVHLILSEEERAKGFVRPVRRTYIHTGTRIKRHKDGRLYGLLIGIDEPTYPIDEYYTKDAGYKGYIKYPKEAKPLVGKYITEAEFDSIVARQTHFGGCGASTKMGLELAETYATNPSFYSTTYCTGCSKYLPVEEFQWEDEEIVGS